MGRAVRMRLPSGIGLEGRERSHFDENTKVSLYNIDGGEVANDADEYENEFCDVVL